MSLLSKTVAIVEFGDGRRVETLPYNSSDVEKLLTKQGSIDKYFGGTKFTHMGAAWAIGKRMYDKQSHQIINLDFKEFNAKNFTPSPFKNDKS